MVVSSRMGRGTQVGGIFNFTGPEGYLRRVRAIDNDAPQPMRQQILAIAYELLPDCHGAFTEEQLYYGIEQTLGQNAAGNPMAGWRQRLGRDLGNADWPRVYDVVCWLWDRFQRAGLHEMFSNNANEVLAANGVVWDLGADGRLHRVLPAAARAQIDATIQELSDAAYAPALTLFNTSRDAYDHRPRRDRDACANAFDAMESVAKIKYNRPHDTFGQLKNYIEQNDLLRQEIVDIFTAMNQLRNGHFGHGMAVQFALTAAEVDFVYLTCIGSILLLRRTE